MTQMFLLPTAASGARAQALLKAKPLFSDFLQKKIFIAHGLPLTGQCNLSAASVA